MSKIRRSYVLRLVFRCLILASVIALYFIYPGYFGVLEGMNFFTTLSPLHLLWALWMIDMVQQLFPMKTKLALGSQKMFAFRFRPAKKDIPYNELKSYIKTLNAGAVKVLIVWSTFIAVLAALYFTGVFDGKIMFLFSVAFYVCDLICVLVWCPFRLIMKNRCCTTCRIFNWDHIMMFSPIVFIGGFFAVSLSVMGFICLLVWELNILRHPQRFSDKTNAALKCSECTDKLCTQYCQRKRK